MSSVDSKALYNIGYGLYVITTNDGVKDNGMIGNTVMQVASNPTKIAVSINKQNYSCETILKTGKMNVNCLTVDAPFEVFERFGFHSGKDVDKFNGFGTLLHSENGLAVLDKYINAFISLKVEESQDLGSHYMFICTVTESVAISRTETMTYSYYQSNVKPKPGETKKKGYVCKICGYVYEGEELPPDFVCPWCKHGAEDFEPIK